MSNFFINIPSPERASKPKNIKRSNIGLMLSLMDFDNAVSAGEIASATGLSRTTISKMIAALQAKGLIISAGKGASTDEGGKKPELFILNAKYRHVMVIQLAEPFSIACSVLDLACHISRTLTIATEPTIAYRDAITQAANLAHRLLADLGLSAHDICDVAVACNGVVDTRAKIIRKPAHHRWPPNSPVGSDLARALDIPVPISVDNVCRFGGYAELMVPENQPYTNLIVIWNDALVGGCVLIDRHIAQGQSGLIGEIGHITVAPDSKVRCTCGAYGCFEPLVSSERLLQHAINGCHAHPDSSLAATACQKTLTLSDIFDAANRGDALAQNLLDAVTDAYAVLIRNITALHDPQKIIIQGVYASAGAYFFQSLNEKAAKCAIHGISGEIIIAPSTFRDSIPRTTGAAFFAITNFLHSDVLDDKEE